MRTGSIGDVTLESVNALIETLSVQDQKKLIAKVNQRLRLDEEKQDTDKVEALDHLLSAIHIPGDGTDSAEAIRLIREERMADLCESGV